MEGCVIDVSHNSSLLSDIGQNAIDILVSIREVADVDSPSNTLLPQDSSAHYLSWECPFAFWPSFRWKDCSFNESINRSSERALARRDITVPAGQSNMAAIS